MDFLDELRKKLRSAEDNKDYAAMREVAYEAVKTTGIYQDLAIRIKNAVEIEIEKTELDVD